MEGAVEDVEMRASGFERKKTPKEVYLPHKPLKKDEELVCDESAYIVLRDLQTGSPCLSFDIIADELGDNRSEFPLTFYFVAGTQAEKARENAILVMKTSHLYKTQKQKNYDDEDDDYDSDEEDDEDEDSVEGTGPHLDFASFAHCGCINRIRATHLGDTVYAASWSEMGRVSIWDVKPQIQAVSDLSLLDKYRTDNIGINTKPVFVFIGHQAEGFAMDWSPTIPGMLATGDNKKNIHVWHPSEGTWTVDQRPLIGHTDSVEDLQWSPNERNVLASASIDKTMRIWDTRLSGSKACMIKVDPAHERDVNVISWNKNEPFIVSGGDDGCIQVWDLRSIKSGKSVATFKHHTQPITTIEWHPTEATVFASGGEDDQIALWDLGVEKDTEAEEEDEDIDDIPPQLLFIHQGQKDIKELHWHPQIPGLVISTAFSGFNIFKTISV